MQWNSAAEFFAMGGYALYVWGSMAATAFIILVEILAVRRRNKHARESVRQAKLETSP
jgi:heme exporter protein D